MTPPRVSRGVDGAQMAQFVEQQTLRVAGAGGEEDVVGGRTGAVMVGQSIAGRGACAPRPAGRWSESQRVG